MSLTRGTKRKQPSEAEFSSDKQKMAKLVSKYGARFGEDWPPLDYTPNWNGNSGDIGNQVPKLTLEALIEISDKFPISFPLETGRCRYLKNKISKEKLERNINSTYPVLHEKVLDLYNDFLQYKREYGTSVEKELYNNMDIPQFVDRLLKNRAVTFYAANDKWQLLSKKTGIGGWDTIGTEKESAPLLLKDLISYDEIKLSAFLYVSGYTHFVNNGNRQNCGVEEKNRSVIEDDGVIIGWIGARLKRRHVMEYQDIIVTKEQNYAVNGYAREPPKDQAALSKYEWRHLWSDFYGEPINVYEDVDRAVKSGQDSRYWPAKAKNAHFDNMYYKKRLSLAIDTMLFEANSRAKCAAKMAYIHVVGIGLGVWRNADHQEPAFMELFWQRLNALKERIRNISDVHFAYFNTRPDDQMKDGMRVEDESHPSRGVMVHISRREPGDKLKGEHEGKLLVVTYAWDGNALPGNEYWMKILKGSGDSAAACSTQVAELHNPHINNGVCARNLRVASRKHGLLTYRDYVEMCGRQ